MEDRVYTKYERELQEIINCQINYFGYAILGSNEQKAIGDIVLDLRIFPPFMVIGESSREEVTAHGDYLKSQFPHRAAGLDFHKRKFYYRVVTD